jgi:PhnB protein
MGVQPVPEGYHTVSPALAVENAEEAIDFYARAFGAKERMRMPSPDGRIAHAELEISGAIVMLSDKFPQSACQTPKELGGTTVAIFFFVDDVDSVVQDAADAGATVLMQPEDQFWGDRLGQVVDPFGNVWQIATRIEDLTPVEIEARGREFFATMG